MVADLVLGAVKGAVQVRASHTKGPCALAGSNLLLQVMAMLKLQHFINPSNASHVLQCHALQGFAGPPSTTNEPRDECCPNSVSLLFPFYPR